MTTEEAVRQRLMQAKQESDRLFGVFMQCLGSPDLTKLEKLHRRELFIVANDKVDELRTVLGGLLTAESIRREVESESQ